jgi:CheY-like chemotaxis protein
VDDVGTNRALLDELLTRIGFATRTSDSGEDALRAHDDWQPDLILMDLRMPGMDGIAAVRHLRASGSGTSIIAVTASILPETEGEARAAGVDAFLLKPFRETRLFALIGELLGVRYEYPAQAPAEPEAPHELTLAEQLSGLPPEILEQLHAAAVQGRARRLESIAVAVREHSAAASASILALAHEFRYDTLVSALDSHSRKDLAESQ